MRYGGIIIAAIGLTCWPQVVFGSLDISQLISAAKAGDTVLVPAGVYRGEIQIDKPLKLMESDGRHSMAAATATSSRSPRRTLRFEDFEFAELGSISIRKIAQSE